MTILSWALRDRLRSAGWWSIGVVATVASVVAMFPLFADEMAALEELMADMPPAVAAMMGAHPDVPLASPAGYLHTQLTANLLPLLLLVFAIGAGARAIGGHEEDGLLEMVLAEPVTRWRVAAQRMGAVVLLLSVLGAVSFLALALTAWAFDALEGIALVDLAGTVATTVALAAMHGGLAAGVGAALGRRGPAVAAAAGVAVGGFLLQVLLATTEELARFSWLSPWHWLLEANPLVEGARWAGVVFLLAAGAALAAAGTVVFNRRDLR